VQPQLDEAQAREVKTDEFRSWLRGIVEGTGKSLHAVEMEAGIRGNGLGKFLRGERGSRHSLTPLLCRRIAPVISVSEEELFTRSGHLSYEPGHPPVEAAILADRTLDPRPRACSSSCSDGSAAGRRATGGASARSVPPGTADTRSRSMAARRPRWS